MVFCDWPLSLSILFSRFIYGVVCINLIPFYCQIIFPIMFIHSLVDAHMGCFHFGDIVNNAAMNIHV